MNKETIINAFSKYANSDVIKKIYPMIDRIDVWDVRENIHFVGYDIHINIFLNDPDVVLGNMYVKGFDPHWLASHYLKNFSKYIGIDVIQVKFKIFDSEGKLMLNWD